MPKPVLRRVIKSIFLIGTLIVAVLFLLQGIAVKLNPAQWWLFGFTGLLTPYLVLLLLLSFIFWLITKPKLALLPLIVLIIGWKQLNVVFAWRIGNGISQQKKKNQLRVVDWNIQSFNGLSQNKQGGKSIAERMAASIGNVDPDIICLQEFNRSATDDNLILFNKKYPYHYFSGDYTRRVGRYQSGCIIFSKYPIIDTGKVKFPIAESLIFADILYQGDTIRIFNTHLQSYKFVKTDYTDIEKIKEQNAETLTASKNIMRKMALAFRRRGVQANLVREALDQTPYPAFICGDFNDVPSSYAYFHIKKDWQDAFLKKGFGIGRTFVSLAPTLRIDYILADTRFQVKQFDLLNESLSDHIMLVADMELKKNANFVIK